MSRFLRFLAERSLAGSDSQLKESVIAVEVFGRKPDLDAGWPIAYCCGEQGRRAAPAPGSDQTAAAPLRYCVTIREMRHGSPTAASCFIRGLTSARAFPSKQLRRRG